MPTAAHEIPIQVFRDRPEVLLEILGDELQAAATVYDRVEDKSNDLSKLAPVTLRADLVLVFYRGHMAVLVLVVEVQRAADGDKLASWPGYVGELVHRYRCPVYLVVLTDDEKTAQWAREPNPYFQPSSPFLPLVVGPEDVPVMDSEDQVRKNPQVALLSLSIHGGGPRGEAVAAAVLRVAPEVGEEYKVHCVVLLMQLLDETKRHKLEVKLGMDLQAWLTDSNNELIRNAFRVVEAHGEARGEARGRANGKAEALLKILGFRGLSVTEQQREQILSCEGDASLDRWLLRALTAHAAAEVFDG